MTNPFATLWRLFVQGWRKATSDPRGTVSDGVSDLRELPGFLYAAGRGGLRKIRGWFQ